MKVTLSKSLTASGSYDEFAQGPGKRHGRSNSLKWPWLYDKLRAKGYDKSKAAAISNSRIGMRKNGRISVLPAKAAHSQKVLDRLAESDKKGKHATKGKLTKGLNLAAHSERLQEFVGTIEFACNSKSCAPPPVGTGGSKAGGNIVQSRYGPKQKFRKDGTAVGEGYGGKTHAQWTDSGHAYVKGTGWVPGGSGKA